MFLYILFGFVSTAIITFLVQWLQLDDVQDGKISHWIPDSDEINQLYLKV